MNQQDKQAIDELFQYLYRTAQQAGPRDSDAEALIQQYVKKAPPGLIYQMAQAMVAQQATIRQLRARLQAGGGAPAGFGQARQGYAQPGYGGYGQPGPYQQGYGYQQPYQQPGRAGGFLAGAGQLALGIGGGIIGAEILTDIFSGVGDLFDGGRGDERAYEDGYQDGFAAGDDYGHRDDGGYDQGGYDDGGGWDGGGYDDGGGDFGGGDF
jgi:hypothetical protein